MSSPRLLSENVWFFPVMFGVLALLAVAWWWWRTAQADRVRWFQKGKLGEHEIEVVLSVTAPEIQQGLSDRASLGTDAMYFPLPPRADHRFWMNRMQFPLDFVWVFEGKVVALQERVAAPRAGSRDAILTVEPGTKADGVLELPAGTIQSKSIRLGDEWKLLGERFQKVW